MAKNSQTSIVDLRLSRASLQDMRKLQEYVKSVNKEVLAAQKAFQDLGRLQKRSQVGAAINTPGFQTGQKVRSVVSAQNTAFLGTKTGRELEELKLIVKQERAALRVRNERLKRSEAMQFSIKRERDMVSSLTSKAVINQKIEQAKLRTQMESLRNGGRQVKNAQMLEKELRDQLGVLKEQEATRKKNAQLTERERGAQSRAGTRERLFGDGGANLFAIQAGLIANFALIGGLQSALSGAVTFTVELDEAMRNLQAIVRVTDTNLESLKGSLIQISEETKFTAVEVANAAVTLGQAGFSVEEIQASVRSVTLLATATGTDLPRAVDIATSVLGVFGLKSSEMASVADTMTAAVNNSKLNIEKLALGLQFSGNVAAQSGLRFEELTSALGAMANAGIRSGSTLGTGMRQILISLQKPSGEFKSTLDRLGLTMADVDIRSKGLAGVLMELSEAGFTSSDAIRSFEVRAASAFNALSNNVDKMLSLEASFVSTTAAAAANETQMRSLANQGRRLLSVLGTVAAIGLDPMKEALIPITSAISDVLSVMKEWEGVMQTVTISLSLFSVAVAGLLLARLSKNLVLIALGTQSVAGAMGMASTATAANTAATAANATTMKGAIAAKWGFSRATLASVPALFSMAGAMAAVRTAAAFLLGPIGIFLSTIAAISAGIAIFGKSASDSASELEQARTAFDNSAGAAAELEKKISSVDGQIEELINRQDSLRGNSSLMNAAIGRVQNQFSNLGKDAGDVGSSVEELIGSLQALRAELAQEFKIKLDEEGLTLEKLQETQEAALNRTRRRAQEELGPVESSRFGPNNTMRSLAQQRFMPDSSVIFNENATGLQVSTELSRSLDILRNTKDLTEQETEILKLKISYLKEILKLQTEISKNESKIDANLDNLDFVADQANPQVGAILRESVNASTGAKRAGDIAKADGLTARQRATSVAEQQEIYRKESAARKERLRRLDQKGLVSSPQSFEQLETDDALGMAELSRAAEEAAGSLAKVEERKEEINLTRLQDTVSEASEAISEAKNAGAVNDAVLDQVDAITALAKEQIQQQKDSGLDPETIADNIGEIERVRDRDVDSAFEEAQKKLEKFVSDGEEREAEMAKFIAGKELNILNRKKSQLSEDLANAETVDEVGRVQAEILRVQSEIAANRRSQLAAVEDLLPAERAAAENDLNEDLLAIAQDLRQKSEEAVAKITEKAADERQFADEIIKDMRDQVRMQRLILLFGEDSLEVNKERARVERENFIAMTKTKVESEALQKEMLRAYDAGKRFQNLDLGKPIRNALGLARSFLGTLGEMGGKMIALKNEGEILSLEGKYEGPELARKTEEARARQDLGRKPTQAEEALIKTLGAQAAENERQRIANDNAADAKSEAEKAALTPAEKREEELRRLIAKQENASKAAEIGIETGAISSSRGVKIQEGALGETKKALEEREAAIHRMRENVNKTVAEEERYTVLLEEHEALTRSIEQQEQRISQEKGRQGILQLDIVESVREWARATLDINAAAEGGLKNTLNSMTSGFSELFQKLSTEPKKAGEAMLGFARTVAQAMQKALAEMMAVYVMQKLIGMMPGTAGDGSLIGALKAGIKMRSGGKVKRMNRGGEVDGTMNRDSVNALLMPGEYVLRTSAAQAIGYDRLDELNAMGNTRMASGGHVGAGKKMGQGKDQNLWLVDERSKAPIPGPGDIVAIISDDMATGGQTKHLIHSISKGEI